jgi:hypothetical protein
VTHNGSFERSPVDGSWVFPSRQCGRVAKRFTKPNSKTPATRHALGSTQQTSNLDFFCGWQVARDERVGAFVFDAQMQRRLRNLHDVPMEPFGYLGQEEKDHSSNESYLLFQEKVASVQAFWCSWPNVWSAAPFACEPVEGMGLAGLAMTISTRKLSGVYVENAVADDPLIDVAKTLLCIVELRRSLGERGCARDTSLSGPVFARL